MLMEAITLLGIAAAVCTTVSFLSQAVKTIRTKQTKALSLGMYAILTLGLFLWLIYGIFIRDFPIILANTVTLIFSATILMLIIKYS